MNAGPAGAPVTPGAEAFTLTNYLDLVTSEHRQRPKFIASLVAALQPFMDAGNLADRLRVLFDLDTATGVQLDAIGLWIGVARTLSIPLPGVFFSFDDPTLGFDQGTWKGQFDPTAGLTILPDDAYRTLLRATAMANDWDGTLPQAYAIMRKLFDRPNPVQIIDGQDMTMEVVFTFTPDQVTAALLTSGFLFKLKPAGVAVSITIP